MHEFSLCQGLISALRAQKPPDAKAGKLTRIEVTIGPLSGVEPELLRHAFPIVVEGTSFEQVELTLKQTLIQVQCLSCQRINTASINDLRCRHCQSTQTTVIAGNECALTHLFYGETEHV